MGPTGSVRPVDQFQSFGARWLAFGLSIPVRVRVGALAPMAKMARRRRAPNPSIPSQQFTHSHNHQRHSKAGERDGAEEAAGHYFGLA